MWLVMNGSQRYPIRRQDGSLFKNLSLKIFQVHVVGHGWLLAISHTKTRQFRLFKNLRLKIFQVYVVGHGWLSAISQMKIVRSLRT